MANQGTESKLDVIQEEIIANALSQITTEMGITLIRTAYSTNIKERRDCSTQLFDDDGRIIAQGAHIPIHQGSMKGVIKAIQAEIDPIRPGDVYISNDPYIGACSHLSDIAVIEPFFHKGQLIGFAANTAHHNDVGGIVPGSITPRSTSIFQEGLRMPPMTLVRQGALNKEVLGLIEKNTRDPGIRRGDIEAQIGSCHLGIRRLAALFDEYGKSTVKEAIENSIKDSAQRIGKCIEEEIPDGTYEFTDYLGCDGILNWDEPIPIKVKIEVKGKNMFLDFSGTAKQVDSNINLVEAGLQSAVAFAVRALTVPHVRSNEGCFQTFQINAPKGTLVNCQLPAAVGLRTDTCQRVVDVVFGALVEAMPHKVAGATHGTISGVNLGGDDPFHHRPYVYVDVIGGGFGGRPDRDGIDGVQVNMTNTSNLPIEALENEYPIRMEHYELIRDSGGAGKYRGGAGIRRDLRILEHTASVTANTERCAIAPWGVFGAKDGSKGEILLNGEKQPCRISGHLAPGDRISVRTPGGGGYGDPKERDRELIRQDIRNGLLSEEKARELYALEGGE